MNRKLFFLITIVILSALLLSACERPATKSPVDTKTEGDEIPFPASTQSEIIADILAGTQTAQALTPVAATQPPEQQATAAAPTESAPAVNTPQPTAVPPTPAPPEEEEPDTWEPTPGRPSTYVVKPDEFPFCIARRFNVSPADLLSINGLSMDSYIVPGFVLTIPQSGEFGEGRARQAHPTDYTVQAGDTIGKIACYFGDVDPNGIYAINGLSEGAQLQPGQVLHIP